MAEYDIVNHPKHYVDNRFTVEPYQLTRLMEHPQASALEYILRAGKKLYAEETEEKSRLIDLQKALFWLNQRGQASVPGYFFQAFCESTNNPLIKRAYYPDVELNDIRSTGDEPKTFWENLMTIVENEVAYLEKKLAK